MALRQENIGADEPSVATTALGRTYWVTLTFASWNRIAAWLRQLERLPQPVRRGALPAKWI